MSTIIVQTVHLCYCKTVQNCYENAETGVLILWLIFMYQAQFQRPFTMYKILKLNISNIYRFAASLCYYGLTFASTSIGSNEYASFALSLLVEVPAVILGHIITVNIGRKVPLILSMILGGVCLISTLAFDSGNEKVYF